MATKRSSTAKKSAKKSSKRIPSVKRLNEVRPLRGGTSGLGCNSGTCMTIK
jgi:hypothetical protein